MPALTVKKARPSCSEILVSMSRRMSMGSLRPARANCASILGSVAENSSVWRSSGIDWDTQSSHYRHERIRNRCSETRRACDLGCHAAAMVLAWAVPS